MDSVANNQSNQNHHHRRILEQYGTNLKTGLTTDQASQRREEAGSFNVVPPPINCPGWICCLLPCIKSIPSMKAFASIKPEDAEVLRNGKWIRYDAASLVVGDIIRMEEGDIVPADCLLVEVSGAEDDEELLVDLRPITGEERLKTITAASLVAASEDDAAASPNTAHKLYMGGKVVQGGATAVITAMGPNTLLAKLIREKRFPPTETIVEEMETGIAMGNLP
jgi:hypothetical protein